MAIAGRMPPLLPRTERSRLPIPALRGRAHDRDICRLALTVELTAENRGGAGVRPGKGQRS